MKRLSIPKIPEFNLKEKVDDKTLYLEGLEPVKAESLTQEEYKKLRDCPNNYIATSLAFALKRNQKMDMFDDIYPYADTIYEKIKETDGKVNNYKLMQAIVNNLDKELNDRFLDDVLNSYKNL